MKLPLVVAGLLMKVPLSEVPVVMVQMAVADRLVKVPLVALLVAAEPVALLWRLGEAEGPGGPADSGGVSSTVHVLVHLLGHLFRVAKVGGGHGHSAGREHRDQDDKSSLLQWSVTSCSSLTALLCSTSRAWMNPEQLSFSLTD